jgi:DNA-directed RNA polymerase subunit RPC12/RpoP
MQAPLCTEPKCKKKRIELEEIEDDWGESAWHCPMCGYKYDIVYKVKKRFKPNEPAYIA